MRGVTLAKMVAVAGSVTVLTTGCLSSGGDTGSSSGGTGTPTGKGKAEVEVMYGFTNEQSVAFRKDVDKFAAANGFKMKWNLASSFDTLIRSRVAGGNVPDVALFPQPGVLRDVVKSGKLVAYDEATVSTLKSTLVPGFIEGATVDGKVYGSPASVSIKSLVWYDKPAFEAAGYTVPKTIDELNALTDKIRSDGKVPWCIGAEAGQATGWVITDWIEDLVLRYAGVENYDKWVAGTLKFNSPEIKPAFEEFARIALTDGNVLGGRKSIVSTPVLTSGNGMFTKPPKCFLHRQATFIQGQGGFPDAVRAKLDTEVGVFAFPPKTEGENPVLGGGDLAAAFNNDVNTIKVRNFIASKENGIETAKAGFLSPHKTFDASLYPNKTLQDISKVLYAASAARFDGSDVMPAKVGAGTFWREPVAWISGQQDLDETLDKIDSSFPKS